MRIGVRLVAGFWRSAVVYNVPSSPDARRRPHDTDVEDSLVRNLQKCVAPEHISGRVAESAMPPFLCAD